jgi:hypothetical protein
MKKTFTKTITKSTKTITKSKRLSGRTTEPITPAPQPEPTQPAGPLAGTDAPVTSTAEFKAGKDL